jgi:hypothetical protein
MPKTAAQNASPCAAHDTAIDVVRKNESAPGYL